MAARHDRGGTTGPGFESPHARPEPGRQRSPREYDATHDLREGRPTELADSVRDDEDAEAAAIESAAARQERLVASPENAAEAAAAEAGPESARREALAASPELQAEEAERLLERRGQSQDDRPVGRKSE